MADEVLHLFAVQVLVEHGDLAAHPGLADHHRERRDCIDHEPLQSQSRQLMAERLLQFRALVLLDMVYTTYQLLAPFGSGSRLVALTRELQKLPVVARDDLGWTHAAIDQPFDEAQAIHLRLRVEAIAVTVTHRLGKAVTPLPDPQRVLWNTGFPLYCADRQGGGAFRCRSHEFIFVVDKKLTVPLPRANNTVDACI